MTGPEATVSIPSNGSIQFLQRGAKKYNIVFNKVSIPSNGSIQFLQKFKGEKNEG